MGVFASAIHYATHAYAHARSWLGVHILIFRFNFTSKKVFLESRSVVVAVQGAPPLYAFGSSVAAMVTLRR